jgi:hypothetical protein
VLAPLRPQQWLIIEVHKVIGVDIRSQYDIAALPPVAAIRSALWYELLTPKTDASVPTVTAFCVNPYLINEHFLNNALQELVVEATERQRVPD